MHRNVVADQGIGYAVNQEVALCGLFLYRKKIKRSYIFVKLGIQRGVHFLHFGRSILHRHGIGRNRSRSGRDSRSGRQHPVGTAQRRGKEQYATPKTHDYFSSGSFTPSGRKSEVSP